MDFLAKLGVAGDNPGGYCGEWIAGGGEKLTSIAPATGQPIASIGQVTADEYRRVSAAAHDASAGALPKRSIRIRATVDTRDRNPPRGTSRSATSGTT